MHKIIDFATSLFKNIAFVSICMIALYLLFMH